MKQFSSGTKKPKQTNNNSSWFYCLNESNNYVIATTGMRECDFFTKKYALWKCKEPYIYDAIMHYISFLEKCDCIDQIYFDCSAVVGYVIVIP